MDALKDSKFQSSTTKGRIQEIQSIANQFMPNRGGNGGGGGSEENPASSTPNAEKHTSESLVALNEKTIELKKEKLRQKGVSI